MEDSKHGYPNMTTYSPTNGPCCNSSANMYFVLNETIWEVKDTKPQETSG